jgi:hypothetical protein
MDVEPVAQVHRDDERGARIAGGGEALLLAKRRPAALDRLGGERAVIGEADDQEGQIGPAELPPPGRHHRREPVRIGARQADIGLALIPGDSAQPVIAQRRDHAVVDGGQPQRFVPGRTRRAIADRRHRIFPALAQRLHIAVGERQPQPLGGPGEAPRAGAVINVDQDLVDPGAQHAARHRIIARRFPGITVADRDAVDEALIELVDHAERQGRRLRGLGGGQRDALPHPDHAVEAGEARLAPLLPIFHARHREPVEAVARMPGLGTRRIAAALPPPGAPALAEAGGGGGQIAAGEREQARLLVADRGDRGLVHPRADLGPAPARRDRADRHVLRGT